jgi:hypothetical protein
MKQEGYIYVIGSKSQNPKYLHIGFHLNPMEKLEQTRKRIPDDVLLFSLYSSDVCLQKVYDILASHSVVKDRNHPGFGNFQINVRAAIDAIMFADSTIDE